MTNTEGRVIQLELAVNALERQLAAILARLAAVEQLARNYQGITYNWGGGGGDGGPSAWIGQAAEDIAARVGATLGPLGQVNLFYDAGGALVALGTNTKVRCSVSRLTLAGNGIDSGTWCWVERDTYGTYWASPLDCT